MKAEELKQFIAERHKPELAKQPGMVYQVWEDGEITVQKSGDLLWQRTLHCLRPTLGVSVDINLMPIQDGEHGYAFVEDKEVGEEIRNKILEYIHHVT